MADQDVTKKWVEMKFSTDAGKTMTLNVPNPKDDVTDAQVSGCMDAIIAADVFEKKLIGKEAAAVVTKQIDDVEGVGDDK